MVEAAVPTIQSMHLLSVVNFIHTSCIAKVNNDNILKRDQSLSYWSQVHSNSKRSTTERHLQGPGDSFLSDVYEESISTKTQGLIVLPKVSITMLQSSIVEEIISVAALDNVQVSKLANKALIDEIITIFAIFFTGSKLRVAAHLLHGGHLHEVPHGQDDACLHAQRLYPANGPIGQQ